MGIFVRQTAPPSYLRGHRRAGGGRGGASRSRAVGFERESCGVDGGQRWILARLEQRQGQAGLNGDAIGARQVVIANGKCDRSIAHP